MGGDRRHFMAAKLQTDYVFLSELVTGQLSSIGGRSPHASMTDGTAQLPRVGTVRLLRADTAAAAAAAAADDRYRRMTSAMSVLGH